MDPTRPVSSAIKMPTAGCSRPSAILRKRGARTTRLIVVHASGAEHRCSAPRKRRSDYGFLISINARFQRSGIVGPYVSLIVTLVPAAGTGLVRCTQYVSPAVGLN